MIKFDLIGITSTGKKRVRHCVARDEDELDSIVINWIESSELLDRELYIIGRDNIQLLYSTKASASAHKILCNMPIDLVQIICYTNINK